MADSPSQPPRNPPAMPYITRAELAQRGVEFTHDVASDGDFHFWTYADRAWAVGPYDTRRAARRARRRYLGIRVRGAWTV